MFKHKIQSKIEINNITQISNIRLKIKIIQRLQTNCQT